MAAVEANELRRDVSDLEASVVAHHLAEELVDTLRSVSEGATRTRQLVAELLEQREHAWRADASGPGRELGQHLDLMRASLGFVDELVTPRGAAAQGVSAALDFFDHAADLLVERRAAVLGDRG